MNAALRPRFACALSSAVAPGNVSEVTGEADATDEIVGTGVDAGTGVGFATSEPPPQYWSIAYPFGLVASARAASAAATFGALTPAFFAWSMAACSLAGTALENIDGIAALSCFSASLTSTTTDAGSTSASLASTTAA